MPDSDKLDCGIYVEAEADADSLVALLLRALPDAKVKGSITKIVVSRFGEIEIRKNDDADRQKAGSFPDGFLFFRYALELYPTAGTFEDRVDLVTRILNLFW